MGAKLSIDHRSRRKRLKKGHTRTFYPGQTKTKERMLVDFSGDFVRTHTAIGHDLSRAFRFLVYVNDGDARQRRAFRSAIFVAGNRRFQAKMWAAVTGPGEKRKSRRRN